MAKESTKKLVAYADRQKKRLQRVELDRKRAVGLGVGCLAAVGTAYADAKFGEGADNIEVFGVPVTLAGSAVVAVMGLSRKVPQSELVLEAGKGGLYYALGNAMRKRFEETT